MQVLVLTNSKIVSSAKFDTISHNCTKYEQVFPRFNLEMPIQNIMNVFVKDDSKVNTIEVKTSVSLSPA